MKLRDYQELSIELIQNSFKKYKRTILCLPTGGGKTVIFSTIVKRAIEKGKRVLILTDRSELLTQSNNTIKRIGLDTEIIIANKTRINYNKKVYVAMIKTILNRFKKIENFNAKLGKIDLIIIDECHKAEFNKILDYFKDTYVLGCTATPVSSQKKYPLRKYYENVVIPTNTANLIQEGYLKTPVYYGKEQNLSDLKIDSSGEYSLDSQYKHYSAKPSLDSFLEQYLKLAIYRKSLIFCPNVETSIILTKMLIENGIKAEHLDGVTNKLQRERIIKDFELNKYEALSNCAVLTTGFDDTSVNAIFLFRATTSLSLYLQMVGRGSRLHNGLNDFIVVDFGNNIHRFGFWHSDFDWEHIFHKNPTAKGEKGTPVKECNHCGALVPISQKICEVCGKEISIPKQVIYENIEIVKLSFNEEYKHLIGKKLSDCSIDELILLQKNKVYATSFIWRIIRSRGLEALKHYAKIMNYQKGWLKRQIDNLNDNFFKDYTIKSL